MNNQKGFTLIELIVVIVILGILAAVAVPKFIDIQDDAKKASLEGACGAVKSAMALAHAKSLVDGTQASVTSTITMEGVTVDMDYGYPDVTGIVAAAGLGSDFDSTGTGTTVDPLVITIKGETADANTYSFAYKIAITGTPITPAAASAVEKASAATDYDY